MIYFLIPLAIILAIFILCANFWIGYKVLDATAGTGFEIGFYMMTVLGLLAFEISATVFIVNSFS